MNQPVSQKPSACKAFASYLIGFVLSVVFMLVIYWLVEHRALPTQSLYNAIAIFAVVQLIVQVLFFLRLNARTESSRWDLISFLFTLLIIAIVVVGTLWIMYNLNYYMVH
jgi:cytochrome o ubiquinol oxidase operon protein cyoD